MTEKVQKHSVETYAASKRDSFEALLKEFVEIPSVSMDPAHQADVLRMSEASVHTLNAMGFKTRVLRTPGNPIVFAEAKVSSKAPTVLVYNHMDVQPGGDPGEWKTDPFTFVSKGGTYWGRGTTDDKGPALAAMFAARHALDAGVEVNIKFLWELEEEIGSPNFEAGIKAAQKHLQADAIVVSDTIWISRDKPACPAGLRGLQGFILTLETGTTDEHSGTTGGAARNPIGELCQLISQMYDARTGKVKIPGFYDDVVKPTRKELQEFKDSGFSVEKFKQDHGFKSLRVEDELEIMKRIWAMPTLEVHGIVGGYQGPGVKTVVPPRAEAKISMRLVPNQKSRKIIAALKRFVKEKNPDVRVLPESTLNPYKGVSEGPLAEMIRRSVQFGFGKEPVFVREGGSIGAVPTMAKVLKAPVLFLGLSLPEHGYHAPNENFDWGQAYGGIKAFSKFFEEMETIKRRRRKT
ncbi:MAG TPA: M20/M25/M40 family metallo-hydrolase [Planctomycetes bacterium]|nr:M20/M25/M40 family metallo-hydrolase [Planctomycetota bacterium]